MKSQQGQEMIVSRPSYLAKMCIAAALAASAMLLMSGCGDQSGSNGISAKSSVQRLASAPANGKVGQLYFNTTENREYIFNGTEWLPHDASVDTYVSQKRTASQTDGDYCTDNNGNDICPDTMHTKHNAVMNDCQGCHDLSVSFYVPDTFFMNPNKPAYIGINGNQSNSPIQPRYSSSMLWSTSSNNYTKSTPSASCANIACHAVAKGTFEYYFPGGDGNPEKKYAEYGAPVTSTPRVQWAVNNNSGITPDQCGDCHGNPPNTGVWHSKQHANNIYGANNCQFCHPETATTDRTTGINSLVRGAKHMNGSVDVSATFTSKCFGCH
ncbi:MAG: hypothetical protein WCP20_14590 [Desulfuromonadales bacterium]